MTKTSGRCSICRRQLKNFGCNPEPVMPFESRVCDNCNSAVVIPERLKRMARRWFLRTRTRGEAF